MMDTRDNEPNYQSNKSSPNLIQVDSLHQIDPNYIHNDYIDAMSNPRSAEVLITERSDNSQSRANFEIYKVDTLIKDAMEIDNESIQINSNDLKREIPSSPKVETSGKNNKQTSKNFIKGGTQSPTP